MKITDIKTILVETGATIKWIIVQVFTNEGIVGIAEAGNAWREKAQAAAMIPNFLALEWPKYYYPTEPADLRFRLLKEPLKVEKGHVEVPTGPGLGIELNEEALAEYAVR